MSIHISRMDICSILWNTPETTLSHEDIRWANFVFLYNVSEIFVFLYVMMREILPTETNQILMLPFAPAQPNQWSNIGDDYIRWVENDDREMRGRVRKVWYSFTDSIRDNLRQVQIQFKIGSNTVRNTWKKTYQACPLIPSREHEIIIADKVRLGKITQ